ncbi:MAG: hypothetical protein ABSD85_16155 [Acidimicrobiales bacterium]|jgi:hypothetical protein
MTTITCPRWSYSFEAAARTSTRCRRCKSVVRIPGAARSAYGSGVAGPKGEHSFGVVLLSCGHHAVAIVHPGRSLSATLKRYDWECPESGATVAPTRVLRVLSEAEWENMDQEAFDWLVSIGAAS